MTALDLFGLVFFAALAWFWYDSFGAREAAIRAVSAACDREGLQFLDETVAGARLRLVRTEGGLALRRLYRFEYSDTGSNRRPGSVELLGRRVLGVNIGLRLVPTGVTLH